MQKALNPEIGFEVDDNYPGHCPCYYVLKVSVVVDVFVDGRCLEKVLQEGNNTVVFEKVESMVCIYVDKIVAADHQMMQVTFCTYGWCNRCLCNSEPSRVCFFCEILNVRKMLRNCSVVHEISSGWWEMRTSSYLV